MTKKSNPASIHAVIRDLFENEKLKQRDQTQKVYFSRVSMTAEQKQSVEVNYPEGSLPLDLYIIQQNNNDLILISFIKKSDHHIYGVYFTINNQPLFDGKVLTKSKDPISLGESATFVPHEYLEVYPNIAGTTMLLGFKTSGDQPHATIQYSHHHKYYYTDLYSNGIETPILPYKRIGLSKNLRKI
jgi:hypothetical protein